MALTGTSSLISGLILIFEWWYFKKYGTSFIEQVSLNYISSNSIESSGAAPGGSTGSNVSASNAFENDTNQIAVPPSASSLNNNTIPVGNSNINTNNSSGLSGGNSCSSNSNSSNPISNIPECKVWKNPMSLLRGAEYSKLTLSNGKEPLTFYDMNLSAQDHQTFFTCESDEGKCEYEVMQRAWRERNPSTRVSLANEALNKSSE